MLHEGNDLVQIRCSVCQSSRGCVRSEAMCGRELSVVGELNERVSGQIVGSGLGLVQAMGLSWPWAKDHFNIRKLSWRLLWA